MIRTISMIVAATALVSGASAACADATTAQVAAAVKTAIAGGGLDKKYASVSTCGAVAVSGACFDKAFAALKPATSCCASCAPYVCEDAKADKTFALHVNKAQCKGAIDWVISQSGWWATNKAKGLKTDKKGKPTRCSVQEFLHKNEKHAGNPKCPCPKTACTGVFACESANAAGAFSVHVNKAQCKGALDWVMNANNLGGWVKAQAGKGLKLQTNGMPSRCQVQNFIHKNEAHAGNPKCPCTNGACKVCEAAQKDGSFKLHINKAGCKGAIDWVMGQSGWWKSNIAKGLQVDKNGKPTRCTVQAFLHKNEKIGANPKCPCTATVCPGAFCEDPQADGSYKAHVNAGACKGAIDWVMGQAGWWKTNAQKGLAVDAAGKPSRCSVQDFLHKYEKQNGNVKCPCPTIACKLQPKVSCADATGAQVATAVKGAIAAGGLDKKYASVASCGAVAVAGACFDKAFAALQPATNCCASCKPYVCEDAKADGSLSVHVNAGACKGAIDWVMGGQKGWWAANKLKGLKVDSTGKPSRCTVQAWLHKNEKHNGNVKCPCPKSACPAFKVCEDAKADGSFAVHVNKAQCKGAIDWVMTQKGWWASNAKKGLSVDKTGKPTRCTVQAFLHKNEKHAGNPKCPCPKTTCAGVFCEDAQANGSFLAHVNAGSCKGAIDWVINGQKGWWAANAKKGLGVDATGKPSRCSIQAWLYLNEKHAGNVKCPCPLTACKLQPKKIKVCEDAKADGTFAIHVNKAQCKGALDWVMNGNNLPNWTKANKAKGLKLQLSGMPSRCQVQAFIHANEKHAGNPKCPCTKTKCGVCEDSKKDGSYAAHVNKAQCKGAIDWVLNGQKGWWATNAKKGLVVDKSGKPNRCTVQAWLHKNEAHADNPKCPCPVKACTFAPPPPAPCVDYSATMTNKGCKGAIDWVKSTGYAKYKAGSGGYHAKGMPVDPSLCHIQEFINKNEKDGTGMAKCPCIKTQCKTDVKFVAKSTVPEEVLKAGSKTRVAFVAGFEAKCASTFDAGAVAAGGKKGTTCKVTAITKASRRLLANAVVNIAFTATFMSTGAAAQVSSAAAKAQVNTQAGAVGTSVAADATIVAAVKADTPPPPPPAPVVKAAASSAATAAVSMVLVLFAVALQM